MPLTTFLLHFLCAIFLGAFIGFERERHKKSAGLRTYILVTSGATLYALLSIHGFNAEDPSRIAAQIITGIGFIGAGTILHKKDRVEGLTTAAGLWASAAIGMLVGVGWFWEAVIATILLVMVAWFNDKKYFS